MNSDATDANRAGPKDPNAESWGIVGGGMLGMTLALRLAQAGKSVTLFEAAPQLGGLADAWQIGDVTWDRHYHVILLSDRHLRNLLRELSLDEAIAWQTTRTEFHAGGQFHPLNNGIDFLRFPLLHFIDKVRLAATIFYASRLTDGKKLERTTAAEWLSRLSGPRTYARIWQPLLRAKLGENHRIASAAFIWAIIRRLYAARRSGLKTEMFGYVDKGYARIVDRLEAALCDAGVRIEKVAPVTRIGPAGDRLQLATGDRVLEFDRITVTQAAPLVPRMCPDLAPEEKAGFAKVPYQGIICASLILKRPLNDAYITYLGDDRLQFTAVIEMTALVDPRTLAGRTLVYLPWYVPSDDPAFELSEEQIRDRFLPAFLAMYPDLSLSDVEAFRVSRVRHVLAISTLNYSDSLPPVRTSIPGLTVVNSAHIVNGTLNVNETVKLAEDMVPLLLTDAQREPRTCNGSVARSTHLASEV